MFNTMYLTYFLLFIFISVIDNIQSQQHLRILNTPSFGLKEPNSFDIQQCKKLIENTANEVSNVWSISAKQLKKVLDKFSSEATKLLPFAYDKKKREALSLLLQYNVELDM